MLSLQAISKIALRLLSSVLLEDARFTIYEDEERRDVLVQIRCRNNQTKAHKD